MRDIYEVPAAAILLLAHQELERLVGTIHQNQLKPTLDQRWAYLVYAGLWWEPLRDRPRRLHGRGQRAGHRDDRRQALQGVGAGRDALVAARRLRRRSWRSFAESGGLFSQDASPGFIELWSLQSRMAWRPASE